MRLLKLFPPVVVVVLLVVARNSAGSIDDTFFKTCFCRRCPGDCGRGHLLYMLSLCPIFALDPVQRTLELQFLIYSTINGFFIYSISKIKYAEEYSKLNTQKSIQKFFNATTRE